MHEYALVTGSTSGIGAAFAERLAREGHDLVLVSRDEIALATQARELEDAHCISVTHFAMDLSEPEAANRVHLHLLDQGVIVDTVVNNAGFNECGSFLSTDPDKERSMIQLHATFTTEMMKVFLPAMVERGYGRVINLGSTGSYMACPGDAVYAATKAYILHLSRAIQAELYGSGVTVTTLCPGSTRTAFAAKADMENTLLFKLFIMSPETVASIGYDAMNKGRTAVVAGLHNKVLVALSMITPPAILNALIRKMLARS